MFLFLTEKTKCTGTKASKSPYGHHPGAWNSGKCTPIITTEHQIGKVYFSFFSQCSWWKPFQIVYCCQIFSKYAFLTNGLDLGKPLLNKIWKSINSHIQSSSKCFLNFMSSHLFLMSFICLLQELRTHQKQHQRYKNKAAKNYSSYKNWEMWYIINKAVVKQEAEIVIL